jgi:PAS domain S-box-containing protein
MKEDTIDIAEHADEALYARLIEENSELKKELQRLSMVVEGTKAGYWDWDILTGSVTINNAWAAMIGYSLEELGEITLATWEQYCHPDDLREANRRIERHMRGETDFYEAEVRMRHKEGRWVWILDRGKIFERDPEGRALRMAGSHQDITRRKHEEETLRMEMNLFLEGPVTVFRWRNSKGFPIDYVSPNVITLCGYSPADFTSGIISFADIVHPDDLKGIMSEMARYTSDRERSSFEQEYRMIRKDKAIAWIYEFTTIIRDDDGNIDRFETYTLDNTIRKKTEAAIAYNRKFEHLVSTLANQFINASLDHIDTMIDRALQLIGEFVQADRSYIFQYFDNQQFMNNTHEWCAEGIVPQKKRRQQLPSDNFTWSIRKLEQNNVIIVSRLSDLPAEAVSEKEMFEMQDIKSLILIPLVSSGVPVGYIGFDAIRQEQQWHETSESILALAGGIIANALQRKQVEMLIQQELHLALKLSAAHSFEETVEHCMKTAIKISDMDCGGIYLLNDADSTLTLVASQGLPETFLKKTTILSPDAPEYPMLTSGRVLYSDDIHNVILSFKKAIEVEGLKAFAILPVISRNRVIGTLNVASHSLNNVHDFARKALETVVSHIGSAIMQARHEERITAVNRNLESLFESIDDMLFVVDENGFIIHANPATIAGLGYSLDEMHTMNLLDLHPPEAQDEALRVGAEMMSGQRKFCQMPVLMKSGELLPVETKMAHGTWDGKPAIIGITRNISERLKNQSALVESEKKFRELTEFLPLPLFETDLKGIVNYINISGMEFFDLTPEEIRNGVSMFSFCMPEEIELAVTNQQKIFDPGYYPRGNEYTVTLKNGHTLPLLLYSTPISKGDIFTGVLTTVVDLSELKRAEAALRENALQRRVSEEFRSIIDNFPGAVYHLSPDNSIKFLSAPGENSPTGYILTDHETSLEKVMAFVHHDDRPLVISSCRKLRNGAASRVDVFRIMTRKNDIRWIENRSTSVFSDDMSFAGIDGILIDITERVQAQEEKQQLEANLKKTQRLETIGTLAGGIAHDFNNILAPIIGYAEMGVVMLADDTIVREYFSQIIHAAERARNLVSQILTFSRAEESNPVVVRVQSIVDEAMKLLRPTIPSTISIDINYEECGNVLADPSQIHQVIVNLCTNAFHAMAESGGEMSIDLREIVPDREWQKQHPALKAARYVQLSFSDTGHGMDTITLERIFEPFFTTKPVNKGTGLGLSVVHGIITNLNGDISVESTLGKGSTFRVYLPVTTENIVRADIDRPETGTRPGTRVLFVDDELAAGEVMRVMMNHLGFDIHALNSPVEALEEFRKNPDAFDLVITDLTMPDFTGIDLARIMHEKKTDLPIILMTGYGKDIENASTLRQYGIRKLVKKPVRLSQLAQTIKEVMSGCSHL